LLLGLSALLPGRLLLLLVLLLHLLLVDLMHLSLVSLLLLCGHLRFTLLLKLVFHLSGGCTEQEVVKGATIK